MPAVVQFVHVVALVPIASIVGAPVKMKLAAAYDPSSVRFSGASALPARKSAAVGASGTPSLRTHVAPVEENREAADAVVVASRARNVPWMNAFCALNMHCMSAAAMPMPLETPNWLTKA